MNITRTLSLVRKHVQKFDLPLAEAVKKRTKDPFMILVGTILSARTKDEVTAKACERLFKKVNKPSDFNKYSKKEIQELIYPVGFYKTKAKLLKSLSTLKKVPESINELVKLPGVGRKTANLVKSIAFGKEAICVDTHVHRIMNRWGYVKTKTPYETEKALRQVLPKKHWREVNYLLVLFGQNTCRPISPHCSKCPVKDCPRIGVTKSR
jgi:endonuclease III